jgi:hypothetical protein
MSTGQPIMVRGQRARGEVTESQHGLVDIGIAGRRRVERVSDVRLGQSLRR